MNAQEMQDKIREVINTELVKQTAEYIQIENLRAHLKAEGIDPVRLVYDLMREQDQG